MDILELVHDDQRTEYRPFQCKYKSCPKAFSSHARIHSNERPFGCPYRSCGKTFIQRSALTVHLRVHTGERPHVCETCTKAFADSSSLARHRRIHTGRRPYRCLVEGCGKSYCRKTTLTKHTRRNHAAVIRSTQARNAAGAGPVSISSNSTNLMPAGGGEHGLNMMRHYSEASQFSSIHPLSTTSMNGSDPRGLISQSNANNLYYSEGMSRRNSIDRQSSESSISQPLSPLDNHQASLYPVYLNANIQQAENQSNYYYYPGQQQHHQMPTVLGPPAPFTYKRESLEHELMDSKIAAPLGFHQGFHSSFDPMGPSSNEYNHSTPATQSHPFYNQHNSFTTAPFTNLSARQDQSCQLFPKHSLVDQQQHSTQQQQQQQQASSFLHFVPTNPSHQQQVGFSTLNQGSQDGWTSS